MPEKLLITIITSWRSDDVLVQKQYVTHKPCVVYVLLSLNVYGLRYSYDLFSLKFDQKTFYTTSIKCIQYSNSIFRVY